MTFGGVAVYHFIKYHDQEYFSTLSKQFKWYIDELLLNIPSIFIDYVVFTRQNDNKNE